MNHSILYENQKRRLTFSIGLLICFAMYATWQMGYIYYMGPSLVITGRTPLPISMDNITLLIALGYLLAIIYMIFLPTYVVWAERLSAITALASVLGLFLPFSDDILKTLIYLQAFCCCFMIGFESFIIVNFFSEKSAIDHMTIAYSVCTLITAVIQNDFLPFSFSAFRILTIVMLLMMLYFFFQLPTGKNVCPVYVKKKDGLRPPRKLFIGIYGVVLVSCLMALCGPTAVGVIKHGVFLCYLADAAGTLILYLTYKKANIHPLHSVSIFMILSVIGFLCLFTASYIPELAYVGCLLIGLGMIPCQLLPLYGVVLMKSYPSRFITPSVMGIAVTTVLLQSGLVEIFREVPHMLNLAYVIIMVVLTIIYLRVEPYLIYTLNRKISFIDSVHDEIIVGSDPETTDKTENAAPGKNETALAKAPKSSAKNIELSEVSNEVSKDNPAATDLLAQLTKREWEVLEMISCGYTNAEIAKLLFISEHTVNDHTKKIYRKLNVHSRHAAASLISKSGFGKED